MYHIPYHGERDLSKINFLVTGGAGYIGSNIVCYLLKFGAAKVRILDDFSTGSIANLENFSFYSSFELIEGDIRNLDDCKRAVEGIDIILHAVPLTSVPHSIRDRVVTNNININGFLNILIASKHAYVKRIVYSAFSSTSSENTDLTILKDIISPPLSPYAITKYVNELYASIFCKLYDLEFVGLRYFNVFGPGKNNESVCEDIIPNFIESLLSGKPPVIQGESKLLMDLTYIENIVQANILAALTQDLNAINQNYNVSCGEQITLEELAGLIRESLSAPDPGKYESGYQFDNEYRKGIQHNFVSISKTKRLLCYYPYFSIKDGIFETVKNRRVNKPALVLK